MRAAITDICKRASRRADDPPEYDYSGVVMGHYAPAEDEQMGDIRRAWRTTTWLGKTIVGAVVVALVGLSMALLLQSYTIERAHSEPEPAVTVTASPIP
jgi:multisubunit Na+/H+ antiporter MnhB subunit